MRRVRIVAFRYNPRQSPQEGYMVIGLVCNQDGPSGVE